MKNSGESRIVLTNNNSWSADGFEIILCGWNNSRSAIRGHIGGEEISAAPTPSYCSPTKYKGFWITLQKFESYIALDIGQRGIRSSFLSTTFSCRNIRYVGFASSHSYGVIRYPKPIGRKEAGYSMH